MSVLHYVVIALVGAVVTLLATPLVRRFALARGYVHYPGHRDVHTRPVVRIGGVAIFLGVMAAVLTQAIGERYFDWGGTLIGGGTARAKVLGVMLGLVLIFLDGSARRLQATLARGGSSRARRWQRAWWSRPDCVSSTSETRSEAG